MHQFAISSVWTDWTTMRWMPCLWQNSLSHLNTAVMQPDRWCVKQTRDTVTWTSARISRRSSVQVSGERSQMPESSRWGSTSTWSFPSIDRRQFHNITVAEFHRSHTIPPLFLSTLGALIVGVAGSLNSLVSCYRGLPCPAKARPVLVLYHGASDAANGGAEWMRTSLWLLYPLGAFLWTLRALRTLWVWCCGAAACALG